MSTETAVIPDLPAMLVDQAFSFPQKGPVASAQPAAGRKSKSPERAEATERYSQPRQPSVTAVSPKTIPQQLHPAPLTLAEWVARGSTGSPATHAAADKSPSAPQHQSKTQDPKAAVAPDAAALTVDLDPLLMLPETTVEVRAEATAPVTVTDATQGQVQTADVVDDVPFTPSHWTSHLLNPSNAVAGNVANAQAPVLAQWAGEGSYPSTESSSPVTPTGVALDGPAVLGKGAGWDSRASSQTDLLAADATPAKAFNGADDEYVPDSGAEDDDNGEAYQGEGSTEAHGQASGDDNTSPAVPGPKPKKSHARKQPEGHIKRARNAFILFRKHITDSGLIPPSVEVKHQNISVVAAKMWREAPQDVRQKFQEQARIEKEEHQRKYPGYRYQPVFRRTDIIRRRVRKDPAEDEKVDAVADALIKGKTGNKLEEEIKDQLQKRTDESSSESGGSRRRRREVGQLSKGALRAQRAAARAKAMRGNLLGTNLLHASMYNAQMQQAGRGMANHPGAQHHLQYAMAESYLPVGYDMDGRPIMAGQQHPGGAQMGHGYDMYDMSMAGEGMYRLPPIQDQMGGYDQGWAGGEQGYGMPQAGYGESQPGMDYAAANIPTDDAYYGVGQPLDGYAAEVPMGMSEAAGLGQVATGMEYRLPPMLDQPPAEAVEQQLPINERGDDPRLRGWAQDLPLQPQQEPSDHVMFNERLFDGALGSASLPHFDDRRGSDEGLGAFDEAVAQANEVGTW